MCPFIKLYILFSQYQIFNYTSYTVLIIWELLFNLLIIQLNYV